RGLEGLGLRIIHKNEPAVLLLQETPPRVELIDLKALKVVASIDLAVEGRGEIARAWPDPQGSRGEAAVLLPDGHLLVAKDEADIDDEQMSRHGALVARLLTTLGLVRKPDCQSHLQACSLIAGASKRD